MRHKEPTNQCEQLVFSWQLSIDSNVVLSAIKSLKITQGLLKSKHLRFYHRQVSMDNSVVTSPRNSWKLLELIFTTGNCLEFLKTPGKLLDFFMDLTIL